MIYIYVYIMYYIYYIIYIIYIYIYPNNLFLEVGVPGLADAGRLLRGPVAKALGEGSAARRAFLASGAEVRVGRWRWCFTIGKP